MTDRIRRRSRPALLALVLLLLALSAGGVPTASRTLMTSSHVSAPAAVAVAASTGTLELFHEDFETPIVDIGGVCDPGASCPTPDGWTLFDGDARSTAGPVSWVDDAWVVAYDDGFQPDDQVAFSTSFYEPGGPSNDWMWSPEFMLTPDSTLSWTAVAYDPDRPDGYEVRITDGAPSASTSASDVLESVSSEASSGWVEHSVDLEAEGWLGGSVRIGFRNTSSDAFLLGIDDVQVIRDGLPAAPSVDSTVPSGRSFNNTPRVIGTAEPGSTVTLFMRPDCTGTPIGAGSAAEFASPGITATAFEDDTIRIYAKATDSAGNVSPGCAGGVAYTESSLIVSGRTKFKKPKQVAFAISSDDPDATFECKIDTGAFTPCAAGTFRPGKLRRGTHVLHVRATDTSGATDEATKTFKIAKKRKKR